MKKLSTLTTAFTIICFCAGNIGAQNEVKISGNACTGSILTANINGSPIERIEWKLNGYTIEVNGSARQAVTVAGGNGPGSNPNQLYYPNGIFVDRDDNIWVADASNGRVQKFTPGNTNGVTIGGNLPNHPTFPVNVFVAYNGTIYVADYFEGKVKRLVKDGTKWVTVAGQNNELDLVRGVWVDKDGNVYCTQYGYYFNGTVKLDGMVLKYPRNSANWQIVAGGNGIGSALNQFSQPTSVMLHNEGSLYITDSRNDHGQENARVMKWAPGAAAGVIVAGGNGVGNKNNQCPYPFHAFVDKYKNVFVSNTDIYSKITKWLPGSKTGKIVAGGNGVGDDAGQFNRPSGIFLKGTFLYVVDAANHRVQRFDFNDPNQISAFTARHPGTYTAVAIFEDGSRATSNGITIKACGETFAAQDEGLKKQENIINTIGAYPNPAKKSVTLSYTAARSGTSVVEIADFSGRIVLYRSVNALQGQNQNNLNIGNLAKGTYFIHIIKPDKARESIQLKIE